MTPRRVAVGLAVLGALAATGCGTTDAEPRTAVWAPAYLKPVLAGPVRDAPGRPTVVSNTSRQILRDITQGKRRRPTLAVVSAETYFVFNEDEIDRPRIVGVDQLVLVTNRQRSTRRRPPTLDGVTQLLVAMPESETGEATTEMLSSARSESSAEGRRLGRLQRITKASAVDGLDVIRQVRAGEAEAGIAFRSEVRRAGSEVVGTPLPPLIAGDWFLQAGISRGVGAGEQGRELLDWLVSGEGQAALRRGGLDAPPKDSLAPPLPAG